MLVLEPLDRALARGASVFAELAGFGASSDAHHITQPNSSGPTQAMRAAIDDAAITPSAVNYINAHGTGTLSNDATESSSIREVFGANSGGILVSSTKSMHGHTLGAAGAIEAVATIFALRHGIVPPTINFLERDPECDLNVVANEPQTASMEYALSNSFAFGGLNAVLLFRQ